LIEADRKNECSPHGRLYQRPFEFVAQLRERRGGGDRPCHDQEP
jgi:hypothetical protein